MDGEPLLLGLSWTHWNCLSVQGEFMQGGLEKEREIQIWEGLSYGTGSFWVANNIYLPEL